MVVSGMSTLGLGRGLALSQDPYLRDHPDLVEAVRELADREGVDADALLEAGGKLLAPMRARLEVYRHAPEVLRRATGLEEAMRAAVRVCVGNLADACTVDLPQAQNGAGTSLRRWEVQVDRRVRGADILHRILADHVPDVMGARGPGLTARTRHPDLIAESGEEHYAGIFPEVEQHTVLRDLRPCSYMCVPLPAKDTRALAGVMSFLSLRPEITYTSEDLATAAWLISLCERESRFSLIPLEGPAPENFRSMAGARRILTLRHREILRLVREGLSNAEIASVLHVREGTVKNHLKESFRRLGVSNRVEAVRSCERTGELPPSQDSDSEGVERPRNGDGKRSPAGHELQRR